MRLRGDWMEGSCTELLVKDEQGVWSVTVGPLAPDFYSYSFLVDGVKTVDPKNADDQAGRRQPGQHVLGRRPGGRVPEDEAGPARRDPDRLVPVDDARRASGACTSTRRPATTRAATRYPVLYLLHGGGDEDSGWSTIGRAGFILDNLLAEKKALPMLVVMPNGSLPRPANLPAARARHDADARRSRPRWRRPRTRFTTS